MGTTTYPLTQQIADTIAAHGLSWTVAYYHKRARRAGDWAVVRRLIVGAYCYGR